ncbi:MAG: hypothetical protein C4347_00640 [Patescibacteria group bacterium]
MENNEEKEIKFTFLSPEELLGDQEQPIQPISLSQEQKIEREETKIPPASYQEKETEPSVKEGKVELELEQKISTLKEPTQKEQSEELISLQSLEIAPEQKETILTSQTTPLKKRLELLKEEIESPYEIKKLPIYGKYIKIFLITFGLLVLISFVYFLKPYQPILGLLEKKKEQKVKLPEIKQEVNLPELSPTSTEIQTTTQNLEETTSTSILPTSTEIQTTTQTTTEKLKEPTPILPQIEETVPSINQPIVSEPKAEELFKQVPKETGGTIENLPIFSLQTIDLNNYTFEEITARLKEFFKKQETKGEISSINLEVNKNKIPMITVFNYFLNPSLKEKDKDDFVNSLTQRYNIYIYYSYTRKHLNLIFETNDPVKVKKINENWEKTGMIKDVKNFFLDYNQGKPLRNYFITKEVNNIPYRVIYFDNNAKFLWTVFNNYLIYGTSEEFLERISFFLK